MRRALKWGLRVLLAVILLPFVLVGLLLLALNLPPVQQFAARQAASLTGGMVSLSGLSGSLPGGPRVARIEIRDAHGAWLVVEDAALDWSPLDLLSGAAHVERLAARRVAVERLPVSESKPAAPSTGGGFQLPVRVDADRVAIERIEIGPSVVGRPVVLAADASAHLASLSEGEAEATIRAAEGAGIYHLKAHLDAASLRAIVEADEPRNGLAARIAGLPDLGALSVRASVDGPWEAVATRLTVAAGDLRAGANGTLDLKHSAADLDLTATAPAMKPLPNVSFETVDLRAHVKGPFATPDASGTLRIDALQAAGAAVHRLAADVTGNRGAIALAATAEGVRIPGPRPDLLEADPVVLHGDARLDQPSRRVTFDLSHPLLSVRGHADTAGTIMAQAHIETPDLTPLAAVAGVDLQGRTSLDATAALPDGATNVTLDGTVGLTGGLAPAAALIGPDARVGVTASLRGQDIAISRLRVDGKAITLAVTGGLAGGQVDAAADLRLPDLHAAAPTVEGDATLHARARGRTDDLAVQADLAGDVATKGVPKGHLTAKVDATGLPAAPAGHVEAEGQLDGAPLTLAADVKRGGGGALNLTIDRADWKSAHAEGALALAKGATLPLGHVALRVTRLDDLRRISGQALTGSIQAALDLAETNGRTEAVAKLSAERAGLPAASVRRATLDARVTDPIGDMHADARLVAEGVQAGGVTADAQVTVAGPQRALAIGADAKAQGVAGGPASLATRATLDLPGRTVALASLSATAKGETLRLLAPARVACGDAVAVDRLRLGLRQAVLDVAGRLSPTLDVTASLRNVSADLAKIVAPTLQADGTLTADARLTGTPARPSGTVRVAASGLHLRRGPAAGLPPASITANATLAGTTARVDTRLAAGRNQLTLDGTAPIDPSAAMNLHAAGSVDLALTDPVLTPNGQRARGTLTLDATVAGTLAVPRASGNARLVRGEFQDFAQGARLSDIDALIQAAGDHIEITRFTGKAGQGTVSLTGSVGLAAPMPVDLRLAMTRASPLSSDLLTAVLDANLTLRGQAQGRLDAAGLLAVERADINVPARIPGSVAVLDVRRPGDKPPPPPAPGPDIGLDVTIRSPGRIFIRGRGLDAEMAGDLHLGGTAASLRPTGGFDLRRGTFSIAGQSLKFTRGRVAFDGSGKLDPTLDFVASSVSGNGNFTANLNVGGYASAPKITLSSTPEAPQDEVLARLLFGQSAASLGPFQLASIAAALAEIASGGGGGGFDPLNSARKGLGLDRLSVGGNSSGTGASLEAGKYVAEGVYVGAKQGTSGGGTQATVQVDITKGLKLETNVGTGGSSATGSKSSSSSSGTNVGLTYQFEY